MELMPITAINEKLRELNLPALSDNDYGLLQQADLRPKLFNNALSQAPRDSGALLFVTTALHKYTHIDMQQEAANQSPPSTAVTTQTTESGTQTESSASNTTPTTGEPPTSQQNHRNTTQEYIQHHVYGSKAALNFQVSQTRHAQFPTISIGAADLDPKSRGQDRSYLWTDGINIQITRAELPIVTAVLLGYLPGCDFANHGADKNKGFEFAPSNKGGLVVHVREANKKQKSVPVSQADLFYVLSLFLRQLRLSQRWLSESGVISSIRAMVQAMKQAGQETTHAHTADRSTTRQL